jgi:hypothetical protein
MDIVARAILARRRIRCLPVASTGHGSSDPTAARRCEASVRWSVPDSIHEEECMLKRLGSDRRTGGAVAYVALLVLTAATAGCAAQSEMTDVWRNPSFTSGPIHKVLVVALRKDAVRRRMWEDAFASELVARGLTAASSYQLFPDAAPDSQEVIQAVRRSGYDAVLVSVRLPDQTTSTYVPGVVRRESVTVQDFYGTFHAYWRDVQDPGHTETDAISRFQTEVWAAGGREHLIWSGTLRTLESVNDHTIEAAVSRNIVPAMAKQGLVPRKK